MMLKIDCNRAAEVVCSMEKGTYPNIDWWPWEVWYNTLITCEGDGATPCCTDLNFNLLSEENYSFCWEESQSRAS